MAETSERRNPRGLWNYLGLDEGNTCIETVSLPLEEFLVVFAVLLEQLSRKENYI